MGRTFRTEWVSLASVVALVVGGYGCVDGGGPRGTVADDATAGSDASPDSPSPDAIVPDAVTGADMDQDGVPVPADCDDTNAAIFPGAVEDCLTMDVDEDCDGMTTLDLDCVGCPDTDSDIDEDIDEDMDEDMDEDSDEDVDEDCDEGIDED
ncbi:MAG: MopE-related protein [Myxococcota bacterium]